MVVEIFYCPVRSGYDRRAASLAAAIRHASLAAAVITPGDNGQFDVVADGELLFSKQQEGRFPEEAEILAALGATSG